MLMIKDCSPRLMVSTPPAAPGAGVGQPRPAVVLPLAAEQRPPTHHSFLPLSSGELHMCRDPCLLPDQPPSLPPCRLNSFTHPGLRGTRRQSICSRKGGRERKCAPRVCSSCVLLVCAPRVCSATRASRDGCCGSQRLVQRYGEGTACMAPLCRTCGSAGFARQSAKMHPGITLFLTKCTLRTHATSHCLA
jgi:hypothetical protein